MPYFVMIFKAFQAEDVFFEYGIFIDTVRDKQVSRHSSDLLRSADALQPGFKVISLSGYR